MAERTTNKRKYSAVLDKWDTGKIYTEFDPSDNIPLDGEDSNPPFTVITAQASHSPVRNTHDPRVRPPPLEFFYLIIMTRAPVRPCLGRR